MLFTELASDNTKKNEIQSLTSRSSECNGGDNVKKIIKIHCNNIYKRYYNTMFFKLECYSTGIQEIMPKITQIHSVNIVHYLATSIVFENLGTKIMLFNWVMKIIFII